MYHPDCKLRLKDFSGHLGYDGSVRITTNCDVLAPDGRDTGNDHAYCHRFSPDDWADPALTIPAAISSAFHGHHAHLGLKNPPSLKDVPIHLHPRGGPMEHYRAVGMSDELAERLRTHIVTAKEAEINGEPHRTNPVTLHPSLHPLQPIP